MVFATKASPCKSRQDNIQIHYSLLLIITLGIGDLVLFFCFGLVKHSYGFAYFVFNRTAVIGQSLVGGWVGGSVPCNRR